MATIDKSWAVIPNHGMGKLKFGMSRENVDKLQGVYGTLKSEKAVDPVRSIVDERRGDDGLGLTFVNNRLVTIGLEPAHILASLAGKLIFREPAEDILLEAERLNGKPGLYFKNYATFKDIKLAFGGFSEMGQNGATPLKPDRNSYVGIYVSLDQNAIPEFFQPFSWSKL